MKPDLAVSNPTGVFWRHKGPSFDITNKAPVCTPLIPVESVMLGCTTIAMPSCSLMSGISPAGLDFEPNIGGSYPPPNP